MRPVMLHTSIVQAKGEELATTVAYKSRIVESASGPKFKNDNFFFRLSSLLGIATPAIAAFMCACDCR